MLFYALSFFGRKRGEGEMQSTQNTRTLLQQTDVLAEIILRNLTAMKKTSSSTGNT